MLFRYSASAVVRLVAGAHGFGIGLRAEVLKFKLIQG